MIDTLYSIQEFFKRQSGKTGDCRLVSIYLTYRILEDMEYSNLSVCVLFDETYTLGLETMRELSSK